MTSSTADLMRIDVDAGHLAVEVTGQGSPVVLVHGVPGSRRLWDGVVERLVADGYRTFAVDLLGVGDSSRPAGIADLRIEAQAAAVTTLLERIGGPAILVGHDYGCPISVVAGAGAAPLLSGLVLSAGNLFTDTPIPFPLSLIPKPIVGPIAAKALFLGVAQRAILRLGARTPGVRLDPRHYLGDRRQQRATATIFRHALTAPQYGCADVEAALPELAMPTRIIWGQRDLYFNLDTPHRAQALIPDCELRVEPGAGHFVPAERPDAFVEAIESLSRVQAP